MEEMAKKLAQELLTSGRDSFVTRFNVTQENRDTGEDIVVMVIRTSEKAADAMMQLEEAKTVKAVANPAGQPCPVCGGSGRI